MPKLTKRQLAQLKVHGVLPEDKTCAICLNQIKHLVTLHSIKTFPWRKAKVRKDSKICNHVFCRDCIFQWTKANSKSRTHYKTSASCPCCREKYNAYVNMDKHIDSYHAVNMALLVKNLSNKEHVRKQFIKDIGKKGFNMNVWNNMNRSHTHAIQRFNKRMKEQGKNKTFKDTYPALYNFFQTVRNKLYGNIVDLT